MNKNLLIFLITFAIGAVITLAVRTARHDPYASPVVPPAAPPSAAAKPVNSICAICGMKVNPKLGTALYQGQVIGFGCKTCPDKFAAHPDLYGPAAIAGQVVEEP